MLLICSGGPAPWHWQLWVQIVQRSSCALDILPFFSRCCKFAIETSVNFWVVYMVSPFHLLITPSFAVVVRNSSSLHGVYIYVLTEILFFYLHCILYVHSSSYTLYFYCRAFYDAWSWMQTSVYYHHLSGFLSIPSTSSFVLLTISAEYRTKDTAHVLIALMILPPFSVERSISFTGLKFSVRILYTSLFRQDVVKQTRPVCLVGPRRSRLSFYWMLDQRRKGLIVWSHRPTSGGAGMG